MSWSEPLPAGTNQTRSLDSDTLIGKWTSAALPAVFLDGLRGYLEPFAGEVVFYYFLERVKAATGRP